MHHYFNLVPPANQSGPLFSGGRFSPLSRIHVTSVMCQLLQATGVTPSHYSSHSFRIGAATTAAAAGLPATLIKTLVDGRAVLMNHMFSSHHHHWMQFFLTGLPKVWRGQTK